MFASLLSTGSKSRPAASRSTQCCRSHARQREPLQGAAQAGQSPRGAPGLTRPYPEPKTQGLGPPYLSCRDRTTVVLSGHGGHTLVRAGQRVLSPADPPHFGVETEPEFLVISQPTRPESPPERSAPGAAQDRLVPRRGAAQGKCPRPRKRPIPLSPRGITHRPAPLLPCRIRAPVIFTSRAPGHPNPRRPQPRGLSRPLPAPAACAGVGNPL